MFYLEFYNRFEYVLKINIVQQGNLYLVSCWHRRDRRTTLSILKENPIDALYTKLCNELAEFYERNMNVMYSPMGNHSLIACNKDEKFIQTLSKVCKLNFITHKTFHLKIKV